MHIIIYSMAKTGTSTLYDTFNSITNKTDQIHMLNGKNKIKGYIKKDFLNYIKTNNNNKYLFINIFREPIDRKLSFYFYIHRKRSNNLKNNNLIKDIYNFITNDKIDYDFNKKNDIKNNYEYNMEMPFYELNKYFNYNYSNYNYNFKDKYFIHFQDNYIFLHLKFKDIKNWNTILNNVFSKHHLYKYFNIDKINIIKNIKTTQNLNNKIYNNFKNNYKLSKNELDLFYFKYKKDFDFYYTKKELNEWYEKYSNY